MDKSAQVTVPPAPASPAPALSRELGLFPLLMMGVGMMIGAGAVIGMGLAVGVAGAGGVLVAFALDGLVALFTGMAYAEMSSAVPKAGSIYNFARIAVGRATGFSAGWIAWFASAMAGSFYAVILSEYTVELFVRLGLLGWLPLGEYWPVRLVAVAFAVLFAIINYRGVSSTGTASSFLSLGQTATLVIIGLFGLVVFLLDPSRIANFKPFLPRGWSGILVCMGVEYIAFEGYEVIAEAGDEALQPRRNLPKAILYSVLIVTATYVLVAFGLIAGVRGVEGPAWEWLAQFGEKGFGQAMAKLMPYGSFVAFLTVFFAATSALNATIFSAARVSYALGRDRMLPAAFGRISAKRSTPHVALALSCVLLIAGIFLPITDLASAASIMFLFLFLLANVCVLRMRQRLGTEMEYGYLMPLFPLVPLAAIVLQLVLAVFIVNVSWLAWVIGPGWIASGMLIYFFYARGRALPIREEIFAVDAPVVPSDGRFRILVPVANADQVLPLVPTMLRLAESSDGCVELVHLVAVPDQVPLADAHRYALPGTEGTVEASLYLPSRRLVNSSVLYCRNPARGILSQARAGKADLILLGWRGRASDGGRIFGRTLDQVLEQASCDVAVVRPGGRTAFRNVLVPVSGGPNSERAVEIAGMLADPDRGIVTVLHVRAARAEPFDVAALITKVCRGSSMAGERFSGRVATADDPRGVILREAAAADLVVLGATEGRFRRLVAATLPGDMARSCDRPIVIVRAAGRYRRSRAGIPNGPRAGVRNGGSARTCG